MNRFRSPSRISRKDVLFVLLLATPALAQGSGIAPGRPTRLPRVLRVPAEVATIQAAIDQALPGDVVVVAPGTYVEALDFRGKAIEVVATEGPTRTTIRPPSLSPVVLFRNGEGPDSRLIGFTIRGGSGDFEGVGGGISCSAFGPVANPYLSDCIIERNFTDQEFQGLGAAGVHGNPILERCIVRRNQTFSHDTAGGVQGAPWVIHSLIEANQGCTGGGLKLESGARIQDSIVYQNSAGPCGSRSAAFASSGGGIHAASGVTLERCLILENRAEIGTDPNDPGGCIFAPAGGALSGSGAHLRRCTIVGNEAANCARVGGIFGPATLLECILRDNQHLPGEYASRTSFRFSDVEGGAAGLGSFDADPRFVDPGAHDYRLAAGSPCIDAGDPAGAVDADDTRGDVGALAHPQGTSPLASAWHDATRLQPSDTTQSRSFGRSLALDGDRVLIGALEAAYLFERAGGTWTERARLAPRTPIPDENFGSAVALDGNVAAVSAPSSSLSPPPCAVYVFERDASGAFVETNRLEGSFDEFGAALALEGDTLVIGATEEASDMGRVEIFRRRARGSWVEVVTLRTPHRPSGFGPEGGFGGSLALSGDTLVVGERWAGDEFDFNRNGAAYVYQRAGASPYSWVRVAELLPENRQNYGRFGQSVAVGPGRVLVGSLHGVHSYGDAEPGLPWRRAEPVGANQPGSAVLDGARAFLARNDGVHELHQPVPGGPWNELGRATPRTGPLAAARGALLVGAPSADGFVGAVYVLARGVELDSLALDQAADEEEVALLGRGLDTVTRVLVGGVEQPLVRQGATELVLRPARREPGFADLVLESPAGTLELRNTWRAAPTLAVATGGPGATLEFTLENGAAGAFALHYSVGLLPAPLPVTVPPTWYGVLLDLAPGLSGRIWVDAFDSCGRARLAFSVPNDPALIGLTVHFQAWCRRGLFGPSRYSFTNAVSLTF
jgi:hypothetical protein